MGCVAVLDRGYGWKVLRMVSAGVFMVAGGAGPVLAVLIGSAEFDVAPANLVGWLVGCWWGYVPWPTQAKSLTPQASSLDVVGYRNRFHGK